MSRAFAEQVLRVFSQNEAKLEVEVLRFEEPRLEAKIRIPTKGKVTFEIEVVTEIISHGDSDPDPRSFGDTQEDTECALRNWQPGTSWTEVRRTVTLKAWNLPDRKFQAYSATYEYNASAVGFGPAETIERIIRIVRDLINKQQAARRQNAEEDMEERINKAFEDL